MVIKTLKLCISRRHPVHREDLRAVENASLGFRSVADSVLLFQQVEERGPA